VRVVVLTLGTRGDYELFAGLARTLRGRGHDVVLASSPWHLTGDVGVEVAAIGGDRRSDLTSVLSALAPVRDKARRTALFHERWLRPRLATARAALGRLGAKADYVVTNLKLAVVRDGEIVPGAFVTYDPPAAVADLDRHGSAHHGGRTLELVALSRRLLDPDHHWPERFRFTGFWHGAAAAEDSPAPDLAQFVEAGPPPVVVTLGSMVTLDAPRLLRCVVDGLGLIGQRGVVVSGWSGLPAGLVSAGVLCIEEAPYAWLFPRAACLVHHGGTGTVAAALAAGRPSILLPQLACQDRYARLLRRAGVAAAVLESDVLEAEGVAGAVHLAVGDPRFARRAAAWRDLVAAERGLEEAGDLIESHAGALAR
jgi:UDP:flavonoid glycosyltransferase YjiC (YdhE family)